MHKCKCKSRVIFSLYCVVLTHFSHLSVFYITTIIYSLKFSFKPDAFLSSTEYKHYYKEQTPSGPVSIHSLKVNVDQKYQNIIFCVQHMKYINTGLGVNEILG